MAGLKSAFLLFMIILIRIFVVFVDDTSSSLQTFKEILAFSGKCFHSIYLSLPKGFFSRWYSSVFFSGPATITTISCSCRLLMDWAVCKKTDNREGGGGGNMLLPVFSSPAFCPTFCDSQQQLHRLRVVLLLSKSYSWQAKKSKILRKTLFLAASHSCLTHVWSWSTVMQKKNKRLLTG